MSPTQETDEELMERVQQGDPAAYDLLFARHHRSIYGYLVRRTNDRERASDLFQETWLKVHRSRHTYRSGQPFRPWLFSIAVNNAKDDARKRARSPREVEVEDAPEPRVERAMHETRMTLDDAIAQLPENLKDAFMLGAVMGFDHREIAAQLGISPANARTRLSRARAFLRQLLEAST